jgi:acetylornithine deacetylase
MYNDYAKEALVLLKNMISIPSFSREEDKVADWLQRYIELQGYTVNRQGNNLWLMSPGFDSARPTLLLNSHIDTVKPVAGWTHEPFRPTVVGDKLYGLGSNDAGASLVCLLQAFFILTARPQSYNLIFAASAEEEVSGANGIESLIKELPKIDFAIVGEPTQMNMAVAEKGLMVLDCVTYGEAGHAAHGTGVNALYKAVDDINWFRNYIFPLQTDLLGPVKMTVTQVNAGTQHNVVPDRCTFVVDVRSNEMYSNNELLDVIQEFVTCTVTARSTRLSSTATPLEHPVVRQAQLLNTKLYGSPTISDQALMPFPSVKMGPGDSMRSHTANEYIRIPEVEEAVALYVKLLDGLQIE